MPDNSPAEPFSRRHDFQPAHSAPPIWNDAPDALRARLLNLLNLRLGFNWNETRRLVCSAFDCFPDSNNWSDSPIEQEVRVLIQNAPWFKIFDLIEGVASSNDLIVAEVGRGVTYAALVNQALEEFNVGWRLQNGRIVAMGDNVSRPLVEEAIAALGQHGLPTAQSELQEAVRDLSRRPDPDCTGAVQHAMAALEAVARQATGDPNPTFGQLLGRHPQLLREPLKTGLERLWGYASDQARHGREGNQVDRTEAHIVVSIAAAVVPYLLARLPHRQDE